MHTPSSRRSSASNPGSRQRPRLLRSSATQASITSSDEIQASLVSPRSAHTAADLLSKVAVVPASCDLGQSMSSIRLSHEATEPLAIEQEPRDRSSSSTVMSTPDKPISGCYFSFPNFDVWNSPKEEERKEGYT